MFMRMELGVKAKVNAKVLRNVRYAARTFAADTMSKSLFPVEVGEKLLSTISVKTTHRNSWILLLTHLETRAL